jgi:hypothetical protein
MYRDHPRCGMSRRAFLGAAGTGIALGAGGLFAARHYLNRKPVPVTPHERDAQFVKYARKRFTGKCLEDPNPAFAMPGRYPGRVVEVHDPASVLDHKIRFDAVVRMVSQGMVELTGAPDAITAWRSMFQPGDRVGIKVNPVGYARGPGIVGSISNFATILAIVDGLQRAGLGLKDIILFERYADEFRAAGYDSFLSRELPGMMWYASSAWFAGGQTDLEGRDAKPEVGRPPPDKHVIGYDAEVFRRFDFIDPTVHNPNDAASHRSHVSRMITGELVNKIITIPVLKDHRSGGITMALKNISHGMANNVARTHVGRGKDENRCGVFIPHVVAAEPIRQKCVLHIMDGLIGVYEGGPGAWNNSWGTWEYKSLFFATDPVALDHVGWDVLDAERASRGWRPVAQMGVAGDNRSGTEAFHLRQPEHVELAGQLGLGVFEPDRIEYQRHVWNPARSTWQREAQA